MKTLSRLSILFLLVLSGPALAETMATQTEACPLVGPLADASVDCAALRSAYQAEVSSCMDKLHAEADARAGQRTSVNSHTNRSRFLICDKTVREEMASLVN
ncbi:MAG: hypothetical protein HC783_04350 [Rhodobacteraceae bacterium]|nr:hypothetical protein [Paracoccaceae bacterium]